MRTLSHLNKKLADVTYWRKESNLEGVITTTILQMNT